MIDYNHESMTSSKLLIDYIDVSKDILNFLIAHQNNVSVLQDNDTLQEYYLYCSRQKIIKTELNKRGYKI